MPPHLNVLAVFLLLVLGPALAAQEAPKAALPEDRDHYQDGLRALRLELPKIAATRFEKALEDRKEDDPLRAAIQLRLIEALVRSGQLEKALPFFELPSLAEDQTALYWKARTLVSLGHFYDAATALESLADTGDPALRRTAALTRARLLASLGETREALPILENLSADEDSQTAAEAKLLRASLHLNAGNLDAAAELLADTTPEIQSLQKQKEYLEARLALGRKDWTAASALFRGLAEDPGNLPPQAVLGHADALAGLDRKDDAVAFLLAFLDEHPETGFLDPFFVRLVPWAAESDALQELLQARLLAWSNAPVPRGGPVLRSLHDPVATALATDLGSTPTNLYTYSLYHRALHLAHKNEDESVSTARLLLARLRLENPNHPLALASLLDTGLLHLANQRPADALGALEALEELASPGTLKAEAAELAARIRFAEGDFAEAAEAFSRAKTGFQDDNRELTSINQGLSLLMSGKPTEFTELLTSLENQEAVLALKLERALLSAANKKPEAKELLDAFLRNHSNHPRTAEARLAVAELSLTVEPLDLSMALAQLDSVDPAQYTDEIALRHLLARLKLAELTGQWDDAIAAANAYLRTRDAPGADSVLMKLGEAYYLSGNYNRAHIQFLQVAKREDPGALREVALFFAAKSALRINIVNLRADGLKLLQEVASQNGPLAEEARLQMGRAYIDVAEPRKALTELAPLLDPDAKSSSRTDAMLLAAEAHRALGEASHLSKCLDIYNELLADPDLPYALSNRIHFFKGLTYEQLRDPGAELESYFQVINRENLKAGETITEWKWFYDCGFSALRLLEESKRWRAAFSVAILLEEAGGYRSEEAGVRARDLQLKHQIWDDKPTARPDH